MKAAWESTQKFPVSAADVGWSVRPVTLPLRDMYVDEEPHLALMKNSAAGARYRLGAACDVAYARRVKAGRAINIGCLRAGQARLLFLPGELFIEYQLAAQAMRPDDFVAMAAYGDYGPGYIGTKAAYSQGGYETGPPSRTAPEVEDVLMEAMRQLLKE
ncbi:MAG: hypothetical protein WD648_07245 [Planctomycetaceae bacterium]